MLDNNRDRLSPSVTTFFVAVVAVLIALIIWDCAASHTQYRLEAEYYAAEYAADAQAQIERRCGPLENDLLAACVSEVIETSREHQRSERDLAAQRDMAKWAGWLLVVSGVGVLLLAATYYEANKTAQAAIAATEITRKDFIATHRPRVVLRNFHISSEIISENPSVEVVITNAGNTPAYIMEIGSDIPARMKENGNWLGLAAQPKILPNPIRLDAGEEYEFSVVRNSVLEGEDWWKIHGGAAEFYLIGVIVYRDEN